MHSRHSTKIALVVTCIAALTAGGAALARTPGGPDASASTAPLYNRVLSLGDLHGFWSVACPVAVTSPDRWAAESVGELAHDGFRNGLREQLRTNGSALQAWSVVAQFDSPAGARHELQTELADAKSTGGAYASFAVRAIPASHGYTLSGGRTSRIGIVYTQGRFEYLLEITGAAHADAANLRARLEAAAVTLAHRTAR